VSNSKDIELTQDESENRRYLLWKGALLLLCLGIFALVMWSGEPGERCRDGDVAVREACMASLRAQAPAPPAKGALSPLGQGLAERHTN